MKKLEIEKDYIYIFGFNACDKKFMNKGRKPKIIQDRLLKYQKKK